MRSLDQLRLEVAAGAPLSTPQAAGGTPAGVSARAMRAITLARSTGAPLLPVLDAVAAADDDERRITRAVTVATAQTRAVVVTLIAAPVLLVPLLQRLSGVDTVAFYRTSAGLLVLVAGACLLGVGVGAIVVLTTRVRRPDRPGPSPLLVAVAGALAVAIGVLAGLVVVAIALIRARVRRRAPEPAGADEAADLTATALTGGLPPAAALRLVATLLPDHALALRRHAVAIELDGRPATVSETTAVDRIASLVCSADALGAPVVGLLRRLGAEIRADELARTLAAAERLPAQLTFPTALCLLPGTLLLIGAPIVAAGLAAVGA